MQIFLHYFFIPLADFLGTHFGVLSVFFEFVDASFFIPLGLLNNGSDFFLDPELGLSFRIIYPPTFFFSMDGFIVFVLILYAGFVYSIRLLQSFMEEKISLFSIL